MSSKPSVLIIPGSFTPPDFYDLITQPLQSQGYDIRAIALPSVATDEESLTKPPATMYDDARYIASQTQLLVDEGKDVILISHSYSGVPMTESSKGLGKKERAEKGLKGGIVRLAYMTALVRGLGMSAMDAGYVEREDGMELENGMDENGYMYTISPAINAKVVFSDLPSDLALSWAQRGVRHSAVSFGGEITYPGYRDVPCSYLVCEQDKVLPAKYQRSMLKIIERYGGVVEVSNVDAGHAPNASRPEEVVEWISGMCQKS